MANKEIIKIEPTLYPKIKSAVKKHGKLKVAAYARVSTEKDNTATKKLVVQVNGLNVRNRPSLNGTVVGTYNKGATWTLPKDEKLRAFFNRGCSFCIGSC